MTAPAHASPALECPHPSRCPDACCTVVAPELTLTVHVVDHEDCTAIVSVNGGARWTVPLYRTDAGTLTWSHFDALNRGVPRGVVSLLDGDADRQLAAIVEEDRADMVLMAVYDLRAVA